MLSTYIDHKENVAKIWRIGNGVLYLFFTNVLKSSKGHIQSFDVRMAVFRFAVRSLNMPFHVDKFKAT